jgi:hypothetical protein
MQTCSAHRQLLFPDAPNGIPAELEAPLSMCRSPGFARGNGAESYMVVRSTPKVRRILASTVDVWSNPVFPHMIPQEALRMFVKEVALHYVAFQLQEQWPWCLW